MFSIAYTAANAVMSSSSFCACFSTAYWAAHETEKTHQQWRGYVRRIAVRFWQEDKTMSATISTARLEARISTDLHSCLSTQPNFRDAP